MIRTPKGNSGYKRHIFSTSKQNTALIWDIFIFPKSTRASGVSIRTHALVQTADMFVLMRLTNTKDGSFI